MVDYKHMIKWKRIKDIISNSKGGTALGVSTFSSSMITAVYGILVVPIVGAEGYGTISLYSTIATILGAIVSFGASNSLLVLMPKQIKIFSTISFITLSSAVIIATIIFFIFKEISISIFIIGVIIFELGSSRLLAKQTYSGYGRYILSQRICFVILSLAFYFILGPTGMVLGMGLSMFIALPIVITGIRESRVDFTLIKTRSKFLINNYFLRLLRTSYAYVDRLIVFPLFGFVTLGNYEFGMQIVTFANVLSVFFYNYIQPKDAKNESTRKFKVIMLSASASISLVIVSLSPFFLHMFFPQFKEITTMIPILGISVFPHSLTVLYLSKFLGSEKSKEVSIAAALHLGIQILGIIILVHFFFAIGIALAFLIGETLEALYLMSRHKVIFNRYI